MRIAIVGSGVSGLSALWLLNEYSEHEVNIYEKNDYPGGHTHTVEFAPPGKEKCMVDTGFIVLNPPTYPNFLSFLRHLRIPLLATDMTFSVSRDRGFFEWAGDGPLALFCQITNLFNPRLYRMIFDILRFNLFAPDLLRHAGKVEMSIGEYLDKHHYGAGFKEDYLLPMTGAIWSTPADQAALDFPASTLIRFFHNHHLLQLTGKPKWLTVEGGSKKYVNAVLGKLPKANIHLNTEIVEVRSLPEGGVELVEASGARHMYDHAILATHSDTTLSMLRKGGKVTAMEEKALSPWGWSKNEAVLHWDAKLMPTRRRAYSAWNYLTSSSAPATEAKTTSSEVDVVSLTYSMNILQHLPEKKHGLVLVTLNPPYEPEPGKVLGRWQYEHPMMTTASVSAQRYIPEIQNKRGISFVGAWTKYGFHEDGFASAMRLVTAEPFNAKSPFPIRPATRDLPTPNIASMIARYIIAGLQYLLMEFSGVWDSSAGVVIILLVWMERLAASAGLRGAQAEVRRLRICWGDSPESRKDK